MSQSPVSEKATIASAFVRQATDALKRRGFDPAPFLRRAGLEPPLIRQPQSRVTPEAFGALWLDIARELDDELFGLDSRPMRVGSFATLCHLMLHTPSVHDALVRGTRLINLLIDDTRVELLGGESELRMRFADVGHLPVARRIFAHETLFVMLHGLMCWLARRRITVLHAALAYPQPEWVEEYPRMISQQFAFDQALTQFRFSALELDAPVLQTERSAREFLKSAPRSFIMKYRDPMSVSARVRTVLGGIAPEKWPRFESLAHTLDIHPTTLRRRLQREGSSYRLEKETRRRELAIELLMHSRQSILDIAHAVGFAEASAFHRAFLRWTGVTPGAYRAQQSAPTGPQLHHQSGSEPV
ncbi:MAG: AraC family transcriptional regulator [Panacagrimonas sp.]